MDFHGFSMDFHGCSSFFVCAPRPFRAPLGYYDEILFYHEGGVDVGDVDAKAERLEIPTGQALTEATITAKLLSKLTAAKQANMASFIMSLYKRLGQTESRA